jgi:hypothetical protein
MITIETFMTLVSSLSRMHPDWRHGQTLFNAAQMLGFVEIGGMKEDPFFNNDKSQAFINKLVEQGKIIG